MVNIKYFLTWFKKNSLANLFTLIFLIPILILIFINIFNAFADDYNNLRFINNGEYRYYYTFADKVSGSSDYLIKIKSEVKGLHDPKLTVAGTEYYGSSSKCTIYFCDNIVSLKHSFFNEKNLLKGKLLVDDSSIKGYSDGTYPIYISYNAAKELKSDIGDKIYINIEKSNDIEKIKKYYTKIGFTIAGIIRPQVDDDNSIIYNTSLAFVDDDIFEEISNFSISKLYVVFPDNELDSSIDAVKTTKEKEIRDIKDKFKSFQVIYLICANVFVLAIISFMETDFIKKKRSADLTVLRLLDMFKNKTKSIVFMITAFIMLLGIMASLLITIIIIAYIYLKYCDLLFLLSMGSTALVTILIMSVISVILQKIDREVNI